MSEASLPAGCLPGLLCLPRINVLEAVGDRIMFLVIVVMMINDGERRDLRNDCRELPAGVPLTHSQVHRWPAVDPEVPARTYTNRASLAWSQLSGLGELTNYVPPLRS